jgi:predicted deacylase
MKSAIWSGATGELWEQPPGEVRRYWWPAVQTDEGTGVNVPLVVLSGQGEGLRVDLRPRVALVAGVHGDEVEGQYALQDLAQELDPGDLYGTIVLVLCANPRAACPRRGGPGTRCAPEDGVDLNRAFPGDPQGSISQRLAAALFELARGADSVITLHGWSTPGEVLAYVEYPRGAGEVELASRAMARASGLERVRALDWPRGLLPAAAVRCGIPAIEFEVGGRGASRPENRALYRKVILNVLRHRGVLAGDPQPAPIIREICAYPLHTPVAGMVRRCVELGQTVQAGQQVVTIVDLGGRVLADLAAPVEGEVGAVRHLARVEAGDAVVTVFAPYA